MRRQPSLGLLGSLGVSWLIARELTARVESTPPGYGIWDFVIYVMPFAVLGAFWVSALVRRHQIARMRREGVG